MNQIINIVIISFSLILISCEDNDNNTLPESATISGTVNFSGLFPETGDVLITLDTNYPPQGPPAAFAYITADALLNGTTYSYSFTDLPFRSYSALTVTYWSLGYATAGTDYSLVGSFISTIDLSQDNPDTTINIDATFD